MKILLSSIFLCVLLIGGTTSLAAIPQTISYQGYLTTGSPPVPVNASMSMTFSLYSSSNGQQSSWSETKTVPISNGIYSTNLGTQSPISPALFSSQLYLGITVGSDPEIRPLQTLASVPYAMQAGCIPGDLVECYSGAAITRNVSPCRAGRRTCSKDGTWGPCNGEILPSTETANGIDDNCDGIVDNLPCANDAACSPGEYCDVSGKCFAKLAQGATCARAGQCTTTFCTLGICTTTPGCTTNSDCGVATACQAYVCNTGTCAAQYAPAGTTANQIAGDCKTSQCDGAGNIVQVANDVDIPTDDGNQCTSEACSNGTPTHPNKVAGTTCNQNGGVVCNGSGACVQCLVNNDCAFGGSCINSICIQPTCNDGVKNGTETDVDCGGAQCTKCALNLACTANSDCVSGNCKGNVCAAADLCAGVVCTQLDQCHDAGVCNPSTGACSNPAKVNGSACDDGNLCTQADTCQAGTCIGGNLISCPPLDLCHDAGVCNPSTGTCSNPNKANGTSCNDGNVCTSNDVCQSGSCTGTPVNGCIQPLPLGASCVINSDCGSGFCVAGVCCGSSCTAICMACNLQGSIGTCSNIPNGQDPKSQCGASTCNGAGACQ